MADLALSGPLSIARSHLEHPAGACIAQGFSSYNCDLASVSEGCQHICYSRHPHREVTYWRPGQESSGSSGFHLADFTTSRKTHQMQTVFLSHLSAPVLWYHVSPHLSVPCTPDHTLFLRGNPMSFPPNWPLPHDNDHGNHTWPWVPRRRLWSTHRFPGPDGPDRDPGSTCTQIISLPPSGWPRAL